MPQPPLSLQQSQNPSLQSYGSHKRLDIHLRDLFDDWHINNRAGLETLPGGEGGRKLLKALWRAFVDGFIDNNEKVASSETRVEKSRPTWDQNGQKRFPILDQTS